MFLKKNKRVDLIEVTVNALRRS